ncbi:MAG: hypothetical protein IKS41_02310 [Alphaproteobacteria bacterium]|nr:hypothetical protein [Alphaproteobacteria bacterium]
MTEDTLLELSDQEARTLWRESYESGAAALTAAKKIIRNYALQEKEKGRRLTNPATTGIYAYHLDYASQAINRLENLPAEQKVLGNELQSIQVSYDFVQKMSPDMSEWEMLHHFQYGTVVHDLSGQPIGAVKAAIGSIYITAWMGLTHQKFKEQANLFERVFSAPMVMLPIGPLMSYRKFGKRGLNYYFFSPENISARERE